MNRNKMDRLQNAGNKHIIVSEETVKKLDRIRRWMLMDKKKTDSELITRLIDEYCEDMLDDMS
jgi:hypothetical protein